MRRLFPILALVWATLFALALGLLTSYLYDWLKRQIHLEALKDFLHVYRWWWAGALVVFLAVTVWSYYREFEDRRKRKQPAAPNPSVTIINVAGDYYAGAPTAVYQTADAVSRQLKPPPVHLMGRESESREPVPAVRRGSTRDSGMQALQGLTSWAFFSVLLGLFPLLTGVVALVTLNRPISIGQGFVQVTCHGELLLLAALLSGSACGEAVLTRSSHRIIRATRIVASGSAIVLFLCCGLYYVQVVAGLADLDKHRIEANSLALFLCSLAPAGACVALGATEQWRPQT